MEFDLFVRSECGSMERRDLLVEFLDDAARPLLEDDVQPAQRSTFNALEGVASPQWLEKSAPTVFRAHWFLGDDGEVRLILKDLLAAGALAVHAALWTEDRLEMLLEASAGRVKRITGVDREALQRATADAGADRSLFELLDRLSARAHR